MRCFCYPFFFIFALSIESMANAQPNPEFQNQLHSSLFFSGGILFRNIESSASIDTDPSDDFLPNASVPGSAGTTSLEGLRFTSIAIGLRRQHKSWSVSADVGLLSGLTRTTRQNANDFRPPEMGSFIFSETSKAGIIGGVEALYRVSPELSIGLRGEFISSSIHHGRDRANVDSVLVQEKIAHVSVGPKLAWQIDDKLIAEFHVQFGQSQGGGINLKILF